MKETIRGITTVSLAIGVIWTFFALLVYTGTLPSKHRCEVAGIETRTFAGAFLLPYNACIHDGRYAAAAFDVTAMVEQVLAEQIRSVNSK